ncbi:PREDICTED: polyadenylate-binding protein-interacting protein 1-like isoform X2 [Cyphomyrmex costatus]|uniref:Polyadenylate-binding protein-interacting protein 1 n=1 Tax=Cyphomyrmex costatus TaxID=456900 RepID=A0A195CJW4_9HYME|nr:PREDICTED: polyadenylate-binding protein-interacting protein 1-like isoform X2 [Cyphomyrmex costatus]KYN00737.1 Polyadenylate-binding protein-interacting protein 1 [Cyphomyrmex costatus]
MDSSRRDRKISKNEEIVKPGVGRGHRVWSQLDAQLDPPHSGGLRRPHDVSTSSQSSIKSDSSSSTVMVQHNQEEKKFALSPQAAEFVPKFRLPQVFKSQTPLVQSPPAEPNIYLPPQPAQQYAKTSVQDRISIARGMPLNVSIPPFADESTLEDALEQQCNIQDTDVGNYNNYEYDQDDKEEKQQNEKEEAYNLETYEHLNKIINILIMNPAEFTNLVPPFMDKLRLSGNMRCLQLVMTTIIEWSIAESNFRYNGARLCKYFDTSLENSKEYMFSKDLFRELLSFQCKWEIGLLEPEWLKQSEEQRDQRKCNGLILFLAELVAQMDESYAFNLGELLVLFITRVLQRPASSSVKYICQALKLAGHVLEKDKSRSKDMENMMRALTELVNNGQVDTHVGNMVNSVHELRKDWGTSAFNCNSSGSSHALFNDVQRQSDQLGASNYYSSESHTVSLKIQHQVPETTRFNQPVMYGPDGSILSAEESEFLEKADLEIQGTSEEEPDDNYDDEIATAYEEFLREAKCK